MDIAGLSAVAAEIKAPVLVDNTFATPYLQRPLVLGADLVVHSTTKYINGHSDVVGGAVIAADAALHEALAAEYGCDAATDWAAVAGRPFGAPYLLTDMAADTFGLMDALGIRSLGDLARHPGLKLGLSQEFIGRADGWPGLAKAYGLPHAPTGLDHGLAYEAIAAGKPWARERGWEFVMPPYPMEAAASGVLLLARSKPALANL